MTDGLLDASPAPRTRRFPLQTPEEKAEDRWRWWLVDRIGEIVGDYDHIIEIRLVRGRTIVGKAEQWPGHWPGWALYLAGLRLLRSLG